jgi:hypothetical protein
MDVDDSINLLHPESSQFEEEEGEEEEDKGKIVKSAPLFLTQRR